MGEQTHISWADHTFNSWIGCTKVGPGCDHCYAEAMMDKRYGRVQWGPHGERVRTSDSNWRQPLAWNRKAERDGTRPFVFCASLADVFDNQVPREWRADLVNLIRATPALTWLLLTKRPQNIERLAPAHQDWPRNAALGCTIVNQDEADRDLPYLRRAKMALRPAFTFVSVEPMLGPITFAEATRRVGHPPKKCHLADDFRDLDWVIAGGESGAQARPSHPEWYRWLRHQCEQAGIPFHFKQWGEWYPIDGPSAVGGRQDIVQRNGDLWINQGGTTEPWSPLNAGRFSPIDRSLVRRVGKAASGRSLDGQTHDTRPTVAS